MNTPATANIIIPVYSTNLSGYEKVSLSRCLEMMSPAWSITIIKPHSLDLSPIGDLIKGAGVASFDDDYFKGINGYNRLMMSPVLYEYFLDYDYILIYQLDCYIFRDDLASWCSRGYDYVGAPWVSKLKYSKNYYRAYMKLRGFLTHALGKRSAYDIVGSVGNGGFSLRRTRKFFEIASEMEGTPTIQRFLKLCRNNAQYNEDVFWACETRNLGYEMAIPSYAEALDFSFDVRPELAYEENGRRLPMGCHGWSKKKMLRFWKNIIPLD